MLCIVHTILIYIYIPNPVTTRAILLYMQLEQPSLLPPGVGAIMNSEYSCSYNTKSDNTSINEAVVNVAAALQNLQKTPEQIKTTVLTKMVNSVTRTMAYPLVMSASYSLGNGDSWMPIKFARHDFYYFQRMLLNNTCDYEDQTVEQTFVANDEDDTTAPVGTVRTMDAGTWYNARCSALSNWSSVELTMGFENDKPDTEASNLFKLDEPFTNKAHKPRFNKSKKPSPVVPQAFKEHPIKPADDASPELKEQFAAWALGNFYPHRNGEIKGLDGPDLWSKYLCWRGDPDGRNGRNAFAFSYIDNIQDRLDARAMMTSHNKKQRIFQRQLRAIHSGDKTGFAAGNDDDDANVSFGS